MSVTIDSCLELLAEGSLSAESAIPALLTEGKARKLKDKYPSLSSYIDKLVQAGVTGELLKWTVKRILEQYPESDVHRFKKDQYWANWDGKVKQTIQRVQPLIVKWKELRRDVPSIRKDIHSFRTVDELEKAVEKGTSMVSYNLLRRTIERKDAAYIWSDPEWTALHPKDKSASCHFGEGTKWCISARESSNYFVDYETKNYRAYFLVQKEEEHKTQYKKLAIILDVDSQRVFELKDTRNNPTTRGQFRRVVGDERLRKILPLLRKDAKKRGPTLAYRIKTGKASKKDYEKALKRARKEPELAVFLLDQEELPTKILKELERIVPKHKAKDDLPDLLAHQLQGANPAAHPNYPEDDRLAFIQQAVSEIQRGNWNGELGKKILDAIEVAESIPEELQKKLMSWLGSLQYDWGFEGRPSSFLGVPTGPTTSPGKVLVALLERSDVELELFVPIYEEFDIEVKVDFVQHFLGKQDNLPARLLDNILAFDQTAEQFLVYTENPEYIRTYVEGYYQPESIRFLLDNEHTPEDVLLKLAKEYEEQSYYSRIRYFHAILDHPNCTKKVLEAVILDPSFQWNVETFFKALAPHEALDKSIYDTLVDEVLSDEERDTFDAYVADKNKLPGLVKELEDRHPPGTGEVAIKLARNPSVSEEFLRETFEHGIELFYGDDSENEEQAVDIFLSLSFNPELPFSIVRQLPEFVLQTHNPDGNMSAILQTLLGAREGQKLSPEFQRFVVETLWEAPLTNERRIENFLAREELTEETAWSFIEFAKETLDRKTAVGYLSELAMNEGFSDSFYKEFDEMPMPAKGPREYLAANPAISDELRLMLLYRKDDLSTIGALRNPRTTDEEIREFLNDPVVRRQASIDEDFRDAYRRAIAKLYEPLEPDTVSQELINDFIEGKEDPLPPDSEDGGEDNVEEQVVPCSDTDACIELILEGAPLDDALEVLVEGKARQLRDKHPYLKNHIKAFVREGIDGELLRWAIKQILGSLSKPERSRLEQPMTPRSIAEKIESIQLKLTSLLRSWKELRRDVPSIRKDIHSFRSIDELEQAVKKGTSMVSYNHLRRTIERKSADYIWSDPEWTVLYPKDKEASCHFGVGTRWCISATEAQNYFVIYEKRNIRFYFLVQKDEEHKARHKKIAIAIDVSTGRVVEIKDTRNQYMTRHELRDLLGDIRLRKILPYLRKDAKKRGPTLAHRILSGQAGKRDFEKAWKRAQHNPEMSLFLTDEAEDTPGWLLEKLTKLLPTQNDDLQRSGYNLGAYMAIEHENFPDEARADIIERFLTEPPADWETTFMDVVYSAIRHASSISSELQKNLWERFLHGNVMGHSTMPLSNMLSALYRREDLDLSVLEQYYDDIPTDIRQDMVRKVLGKRDDLSDSLLEKIVTDNRSVRLPFLNATYEPDYIEAYLERNEIDERKIVGFLLDKENLSRFVLERLVSAPLIEDISPNIQHNFVEKLLKKFDLPKELLRQLIERDFVQQHLPAFMDVLAYGSSFDVELYKEINQRLIELDRDQLSVIAAEEATNEELVAHLEEELWPETVEDLQRAKDLLKNEHVSDEFVQQYYKLSVQSDRLALQAVENLLKSPASKKLSKKKILGIIDHPKFQEHSTKRDVSPSRIFSAALRRWEGSSMSEDTQLKFIELAREADSWHSSKQNAVSILGDVLHALVLRNDLTMKTIDEILDSILWSDAPDGDTKWSIIVKRLIRNRHLPKEAYRTFKEQWLHDVKDAVSIPLDKMIRGLAINPAIPDDLRREFLYSTDIGVASFAIQNASTSKEELKKFVHDPEIRKRARSRSTKYRNYFTYVYKPAVAEYMGFSVESVPPELVDDFLMGEEDPIPLEQDEDEPTEESFDSSVDALLELAAQGAPLKDIVEFIALNEGKARQLRDKYPYLADTIRELTSESSSQTFGSTQGTQDKARVRRLEERYPELALGIDYLSNNGLCGIHLESAVASIIKAQGGTHAPSKAMLDRYIPEDDVIEEGKARQLRDKYPKLEYTINMFVEDGITGELLRWAVNRIRDEVGIRVDTKRRRSYVSRKRQELTDLLTAWMELRRDVPSIRRDIHSFSSTKELRKVVEKGRSMVSYNQLRRSIERREAVYIWSDVEWTALTPLTTKAGCYYGAGTKWCISATEAQNYFVRYERKNRRAYILIQKDAEFKSKYKKIAIVLSVDTQRVYEIKDTRNNPMKRRKLRSVLGKDRVRKILPMLRKDAKRRGNTLAYRLVQGEASDKDFQKAIERAKRDEKMAELLLEVEEIPEDYINELDQILSKLDAADPDDALSVKTYHYTKKLLKHPAYPDEKRIEQLREFTRMDTIPPDHPIAERMGTLIKEADRIPSDLQRDLLSIFLSDRFDDVIAVKKSLVRDIIERDDFDMDLVSLYFEDMFGRPDSKAPEDLSTILGDEASSNLKAPVSIRNILRSLAKKRGIPENILERIAEFPSSEIEAFIEATEHPEYLRFFIDEVELSVIIGNENATEDVLHRVLDRVENEGGKETWLSLPLILSHPNVTEDVIRRVISLADSEGMLDKHFAELLADSPALSLDVYRDFVSAVDGEKEKTIDTFLSSQDDIPENIRRHLEDKYGAEHDSMVSRLLTSPDASEEFIKDTLEQAIDQYRSNPEKGIDFLLRIAAHQKTPVSAYEKILDTVEGELDELSVLQKITIKAKDKPFSSDFIRRIVDRIKDITSPGGIRNSLLESVVGMRGVDRLLAWHILVDLSPSKVSDFSSSIDLWIAAAKNETLPESFYMEFFEEASQEDPRNILPYLAENPAIPDSLRHTLTRSDYSRVRDAALFRNPNTTDEEIKAFLEDPEVKKKASAAADEKRSSLKRRWYKSYRSAIAHLQGVENSQQIPVELVDDYLEDPENPVEVEESVSAFFPTNNPHPIVDEELEDIDHFLKVASGGAAISDILHLLIEGKASTLKKKYPKWAFFVDEWVSKGVDGELLKWAFKMLDEKIGYPNTPNASLLRKIPTLIAAWKELRRDVPKIRKDIHRFSSFEELEKAVKGARSKVRVNKIRKRIKREEADYLYSDDRYTLLLPKARAASCHFGVKDEWCISYTEARNRFTEHLERNRWYYFLIDTQKKKGDRQHKFAISVSPEDGAVKTIWNAENTNPRVKTLEKLLGQDRWDEISQIMVKDAKQRGDTLEWRLSMSRSPGPSLVTEKELKEKQSRILANPDLATLVARHADTIPKKLLTQLELLGEREPAVKHTLLARPDADPEKVAEAVDEFLEQPQDLDHEPLVRSLIDSPNLSKEQLGDILTALSEVPKWGKPHKDYAERLIKLMIAASDGETERRRFLMDKLAELYEQGRIFPSDTFRSIFLSLFFRAGARAYSLIPQDLIKRLFEDGLTEAATTIISKTTNPVALNELWELAQHGQTETFIRAFVYNNNTPESVLLDIVSRDDLDINAAVLRMILTHPNKTRDVLMLFVNNSSLGRADGELGAVDVPSKLFQQDEFDLDILKALESNHELGNSFYRSMAKNVDDPEIIRYLYETQPKARPYLIENDNLPADLVPELISIIIQGDMIQPATTAMKNDKVPPEQKIKLFRAFSSLPEMRRVVRYTSYYPEEIYLEFLKDPTNRDLNSLVLQKLPDKVFELLYKKSDPGVRSVLANNKHLPRQIALEMLYEEDYELVRRVIDNNLNLLLEDYEKFLEDPEIQQRARHDSDFLEKVFSKAYAIVYPNDDPHTTTYQAAKQYIGLAPNEQELTHPNENKLDELMELVVREAELSKETTESVQGIFQDDLHLSVLVDAGLTPDEDPFLSFVS